MCRSAHPRPLPCVVPRTIVAFGLTIAGLSSPRPALADKSDPKVAELHLPGKTPAQVRVEAVAGAEQAQPLKAAPAGDSSVRVRLGEQLLVHLAETDKLSKPTALTEKAKAPLPSMLVLGVRDPKLGTTVAREYQPFLSALIAPLRWDAGLGSYVTSVVVGLDPLSGEDDDSVALKAAIRFQLSAENIDNIEPAGVDVTEVGARGYRTFQVSTRQFARPIRVTAHSRFGDKLFEAGVDPGPTFFELTQSASSVDGFGLGKATIGVSQHAANRQLLPAMSALRVGLKTSAGLLNPPHIDIAAGSAVGETSLISTGWGEARVTETGNEPARVSGVTIAFAFPAVKFALGLLGAACAGILRIFSAKRERRRSWGVTFVGCLATGITIDILVALGAPVAPAWVLTVIQSELAWFAVGLIGGYPGVALVAALGQKWFELKKEEPVSSSAGA